MLVDGTVKRVPTARINLDTPFFTGQVEAMRMDNPVCPLVLGNIPGVRAPGEPDPEWRDLEAGGSFQSAVAIQYVSAVQTRGQQEKASTPLKPLKVSPQIRIDVTAESLKEAQKNNSSLERYWNLASSGTKSRTKSTQRVQTSAKGAQFLDYH